MAVYQFVKNWLPNPDRWRQLVTQAAKLHLAGTCTENEASRAVAEGIERVGVGRNCSMVRHHTSLAQERSSPVDPVLQHSTLVANNLSEGLYLKDHRKHHGANSKTPLLQRMDTRLIELK